jgi:hypothetical protein
MNAAKEAAKAILSAKTMNRLVPRSTTTPDIAKHRGPKVLEFRGRHHSQLGLSRLAFESGGYYP